MGNLKETDKGHTVDRLQKSAFLGMRKSSFLCLLLCFHIDACLCTSCDSWVNSLPLLPQNKFSSLVSYKCVFHAFFLYDTVLHFIVLYRLQ